MQTPGRYKHRGRHLVDYDNISAVGGIPIAAVAAVATVAVAAVVQTAATATQDRHLSPEASATDLAAPQRLARYAANTALPLHGLPVAADGAFAQWNAAASGRTAEGVVRPGVESALLDVVVAKHLAQASVLHLVSIYILNTAK